MNRRFTPLAAPLLLALGVACSQASVPPGTPPPEYERRPVEPWPPASALTATPPAEPSPAESAAEPAPADVPSDAGAPEAPDAAADAAPETGPF